MTSMWGILGMMGGSLFSLWAIFRYILLGQYTLDANDSKRVFDLLKRSKNKQWILSSNYVLEPKYPALYETVVYMNGCIFFFYRGEKLMTAGWQSKEDTSYILFPRWWRNKIEKILKDEGVENGSVSIMALLPTLKDKLGDLQTESNPTIYLDPTVYSDIENDVVKVLNKEKNKTGCLLYGPPGNGKTQFVKYLAKKYSLPIYLVYLNPEYNNHDLALMFASIPRKCIVLMEDFDNYFDKRKCIIKNEHTRFTFDALINALDGVYNDYRQVIFVMTANDITKVDSSIKSRPSRFKFVKKVDAPSEETRMRILKDQKLVAKTKGWSLDKVFSLVK